MPRRMRLMHFNHWPVATTLAVMASTSNSKPGMSSIDFPFKHFPSKDLFKKWFKADIYKALKKRSLKTGWSHLKERTFLLLPLITPNPHFFDKARDGKSKINKKSKFINYRIVSEDKVQTQNFKFKNKISKP